jgi:hypothetical protein
MRRSLGLRAVEWPVTEPKLECVKALIFGMITVFLAVALLLTAMEILLRLIVNSTFTAQTDAPLVRSPIPGLGYELAPNHERAGVRTDALGLRWRPVDAGPVGYSVLIVGDSIAYGSGVPYEKSFAVALESRLIRSLGEATAVWNAAVPGYNTDQQAILLSLKGPLVKPDLVLVQFCLNDYLDPPTLTLGGTLDATRIDGDSGVSLLGIAYRSRVFVFTKEKVKDLQKARPEWFPVWAHYIHSVHKKAGWQRAQAALVRIRETAEKLDARLLVVLFPVEQQLRIDDREPQDDMVRFARDHGSPLLDLYDSFRRRWREGLYIDFWEQALQMDKLHLNERGHALSAEEIGTRILQDLGSDGSADESVRITQIP